MWPFLRKGNVKKKKDEAQDQHLAIMERLAIMETAHSPWPDNINTAVGLSIRAGCTAADVYPLICDRPNIKDVLVCGRKYTSQEIRNTSFHERLGGSRPIIESTNPTAWADALAEIPPIRVPVPMPAIDPGWQPQLTETQRVVFNQPVEGIWQQAQRARQTTPEYDRYFEQLMRENPNYAQFGDASRTATEIPRTAPEIAWDGQFHPFPTYHPDPLMDFYYPA